MAKKRGSARALKAHEQIFQLHISLLGTKPLVWRRILVPGYFTLEKLHSILQIVMGWQMSYLYDFQVGQVRYAEPDEFDELPARPLATSISAAFGEQKSIAYNYDFGDGWQHEIWVEAVTSQSVGVTYPICIGGENACPPEDCMGTPGYADLKQIIADPKHAEHESTMRWLGGFFDPTSFDPNRINRDMLWTIDWRGQANDQGLYLPFSRHFSEEDIGH